MRSAILAAALGAAALGLGGCAVYPATPAYYARPPVVVGGYVAPPPPAYYYRPRYGYGYGYGWRRW